MSFLQRFPHSNICSFLHYTAKDAVLFATILQDCSYLLAPNLHSNTQQPLAGATEQDSGLYV